MANFDGHLQCGYNAHIITTLAIAPLSIYHIPIQLLIGLIGISLPVTMLYSILPDIDHPSSRTYNLFKYFLFCSGTLVSVSLYFSVFQLAEIHDIPMLTDYKKIVVSTVISLSSLVTAVGFVRFFRKIRPPHRGVTHSLTFGILVSTMFAILVFGLLTQLTTQEHTAIVSGIILIYALAGFISHLIADGMFFKKIFPTTIVHYLRRLGSRIKFY